MTITCEVERNLGNNKDPITVGEKLTLRCPWDDQEGVTPEVTLDEKEFFVAQVRGRTIDVKKKIIEIQIVPVSTGEIKVTGLKINDQSVKEFSIEVASVQDPNHPIQQPVGPLAWQNPGLPVSFWAVVAGTIVFLMGLLFVIGLNKSRKRKVIELWKSRVRWDLSPLDELSLKFRELKNAGLNTQDSSNKVFESVLTFLGRIFDEPLPFYSNRRRQKMISKLLMLLNNDQDLRLWLTEWNEVAPKLNRDDLIYFIDWFLEIAPKLVMEIQRAQRDRVALP